MNVKTLTLLHSNDIHGDFLPTMEEGVEVGGVARLSGYVRQERAANPATIYAVAGDMFRGSVLDSEFKGIATIDIMNRVNPDIATLGNHEVDYGVPHLLFLERYADFPIINANMYLKARNRRLFTSHKVVEVDGLRVLFIGLVTPNTLAQTVVDPLIGEHVDFADPLPEVKRVCGLYKRSAIDLTVVLSHLGWPDDSVLAEQIDPSWGVDLIVGGHSHLMFDHPEVVNGIPIVQLGMGSCHIGRFDLRIDADTHKLLDYEWKSVRLSADASPEDEALGNAVNGFKCSMDEKYSQKIVEFGRELTHPKRDQETELGNLLCDLLKTVYDVDMALLSSSSIRAESLGPVVTLDDFLSAMPYEGPVTVLKLTGRQLMRGMRHLMRDQNWEKEPKFFQLDGGVRLEYDRTKHEIVRFDVNGEPLDEDRIYYVSVDEYHFLSSQKNFGLTREEIVETGHANSVSVGYRQALLSCFAKITDARKRAKLAGVEPDIVFVGRGQIDPAAPLEREVEGRIVIHH